MTLRQPKFTINDTFYRMCSNAVLKDTIDKVVITATPNGIEIEYRGISSNTLFYEEEIFQTKQELLESL